MVRGLSAGGKWIRTVGTRQISYRFRRTFVASVAVPVPERDSFLSRRGTESLNPSPSSSESGELPYCRRRLDPDRRQRLESAALVQMRHGSRCTAPVTTTGRGCSSRVDVMRLVRRCSETAGLGTEIDRQAGTLNWFRTCAV